MAKLNEKKVAAVKKLAQGGPGQKIKEKADRVTQGIQGYFSGRENAIKGAFGPTASGVASNVVSGMRQKATTAQGKGGQTMGQKANKAQGAKGRPVVQAIANKLTGTSATTSAPVAPATKQETLKISTVELPTVFEIDNYKFNRRYDKDSVLDALAKVGSTYGKKSKEFMSIVSAIGAKIDSNGNITGYTGKTYKKPDLRKDAGKSYVDTAQTVLGNPSLSTRNTPSVERDRDVSSGIDQDLINDDKAIRLLEKFGAKSARSLSQDKEATRR